MANTFKIDTKSSVVTDAVSSTNTNILSAGGSATLVLLSILVSNKKSYKLNYLILIFFTNIFVFSLFFILPRYKLTIIPLQIIFTNIFIQYLLEKFYKKKLQTKWKKLNQ